MPPRATSTLDDRDDSSVKLVVGLGNPGRQYARTRHNVGFRAVQAVARLWDCSSPRGAFGGKTYDARPMRGQDRSRRVVLLQPHTFMNCSGQAVKGMVSFYKADLDDLLVVLDDIALPLGALRMRAVGSAGGHNGLADVLMHLGSQEVPRLRIGVGAPLENMDAADFVLGPFGSDETEIIERAVNLAARAVEDWVFSGIDYVMDNYNQKVEPQDPKIRDTRQ